MKRSQKEKGFILWIVLILIALALLKYFFDWSIFDAAASEEGKGTINYIRQILNSIWHYIGAPVRFIWNEIVWPILDFVWRAFQNLLEEGNKLNK